MLEYNYIIILINTIKKRLQLVFKEISHEIFKLFYGQIDQIESNSDKLEIINSIFDKLRRERYSSFDSGVGKDFEDGKLSLLDLYKWSYKNQDIEMKSGKQELYESIINQFI